MKNLNLQKLTGVLLLFVWQSQALGQESMENRLERCVAIDDDGARLACFDALAESHKSGDVPAPPAIVAAPPSGPVPLTDDVGKARIETPDYADVPRFSARVTSCRKNPQSGQYSFSFANGQVWKQSTYRILRLRNCDFEVEILKVSFGYDMYIPSKDRTVRIKRIR